MKLNKIVFLNKAILRRANRRRSETFQDAGVHPGIYNRCEKRVKVV